MLRGTRILFGKEADLYRLILDDFRVICKLNGFTEIVVPSIWEEKTFKDKLQGQTLDQMWTFKDKGNRDCCLIPEVTGIVQDMYNTDWGLRFPKPIKLFYEAKVYRYDKPQSGRYREFTQFGIEILGTINQDLEDECKSLLHSCIEQFTTDYVFIPKVTRGLGYYVEDGFEVELPSLGAQKQVAGGGKYKEGIGWAIGVDRLMMVAVV